MRFRRIFPALHLYPSDTQQNHARPAGMRGLRHKARHNALRRAIAGSASPPLLTRPKLDNFRKAAVAVGCPGPPGWAEAPTDFRLFDLEKLKQNESEAQITVIDC
jgi:hypothetical protein